MSEEIRQVVENILREQRLWNFTQLYGKEHNLLRGTHNLQYENLGWVNVEAYGGLTDTPSQIGDTETTIVISSKQKVNKNVAIPTTMSLKFLRGGSFDISAGKTVTINGHIDAGLWQIFKCAGSVEFGVSQTAGSQNVYH